MSRSLHALNLVGARRVWPMAPEIRRSCRLKFSFDGGMLHLTQAAVEPHDCAGPAVLDVTMFGSLSCPGEPRSRTHPTSGSTLAAGLESLPPRFPLSSISCSLLGDQVLAMQRLAAGLASRTEPCRLAAGAVGVVQRAVFPWRFAPGLAPGAQRQDHGIEGL